MAPAVKRVPSVREKVFRVTRKAPSSQWRSQGSVRSEVSLSPLIGGLIFDHSELRALHHFIEPFTENKHFEDFGGPYKVKGAISPQKAFISSEKTHTRPGKAHPRSKRDLPYTK